MNESQQDSLHAVLSSDTGNTTQRRSRFEYSVSFSTTVYRPQGISLVSLRIWHPVIQRKMSTTIKPERVLEKLGGCGRYQILLAGTLHTMKLTVAWSMYNMVLAAAVPQWSCALNSTNTDRSSNGTVVNVSFVKTCVVRDRPCDKFQFDTYMKTMASEWDLVCQNSWIPTMIASVQMIGLFVGNFFSGHLADALGRKPPIFISLAIILVFSIVAFLSTSWVMFAVARTAIGIGAGCFLTIQYSIVAEVTWAKWRAVNVNIPSWALECCLYALVAWLVRDWRHMHLITGLTTLPFVVTWCFIQESFRWYLSHDRTVHAKNVLQNIARFNRRHLPDDIALELLGDVRDNTKVADSSDVGDRRKYTVLDLFRTKYLTKITVFLLADWLALGMVSYGIQFGLQALSGNFFLNLLLLGVTSIPSSFVGIALANTVGRRYGAILSYGLGAVACLAVGVVQRIDFAHQGTLTSVFAFIANFSIAVSWGVVQTMTLELYPTVVRNIGYGFQNTLSRIGAVIGPQIAYLDTRISGIMYFIIGALEVVCVISSFMLPETKNADLDDKITH